MEVDVVINMPDNHYKVPHQAKCSFPLEEDIKNQRTSIYLHTGAMPSLRSLNLFLVIVVADAMTIYSVYNSDVMYKKRKKPLQIFA